MNLLAHAAGGFDAVGLSPGLVRYLTVAGVVLATLVVRAHVARTAPVGDGDGAEDERWPGDQLPSPARAVAAVVGIGGLAATLVVAWFGSEQVGVSPITKGVFSAFWIGGQLVAVLLGDVWRVVDPYAHLTRLLPRRATPTGGPDLPWLPAVALLTFGWMWVAWTDGIEPRHVAWWLTAYTVVLLGGGAAWGLTWVRRHEAFSVAFGLLAMVSVVDWRGRRPRLRNPFAVLGGRTLDRRQGAVLAVLVGVALFDAVSYTQWWNDLLGVRSTSGYSLLNTLGLVWLVGTAAVVWIAVAKLAGAVADQPVQLGLRLAAPVAALAAAFALSHEIGALANDLRVVLLQSSDPLARGWDLFGTGDWPPAEVASSATQAWASLAVLEAGLLLALAGFGGRAVARFGVRAGVRALWVLAGLVLVAALVGLELLVGI